MLHGKIFPFFKNSAVTFGGNFGVFLEPTGRQKFRTEQLPVQIQGYYSYFYRSEGFKKFAFSRAPKTQKNE
jgi:hypothetical protein